MKRKSQILALLMALCLLASLAVVPAAADDPDNGNNEEIEQPGGTGGGSESGGTGGGSESGGTGGGSESGGTGGGSESGGTGGGSESGGTGGGSESGGTGGGSESGGTGGSSESGGTGGSSESGGTGTGSEQKPPVVTPDPTPTTPTGTPGSSDLSCPSSVDLGTLEKDASSSSRTKTFTLKNSSAYAMTLSASSPSGWTVSDVPSTLAAGESATVTVQLSSASSTGNYDKRLTITASFTDGSGFSEFSVSLRAEVAEKGYSITADPASKDLGKLKEGYTEAEAKEKEVTVTIQNKGAASVRMDGVKGNDHFTVTAVRSDSETLANGDKTNYKIVPKQGLAVGTYTDTITFQTREGATATFKATVVIEKKVDPLTVEPATLDFGVAEEGYAALTQQTVTVKNNTEYAVRLEQPSSFSYEVSLLSQTSLAAGGSATFSIRPRTGLPANLYDGVVEIYGYSGDSAQTAKLTVKFTVNRPSGPSSFSDVPADSTFADDIAYVSQKGLMGGVGEGRFNPQAPVTRGQLVTILYRLENQPAVSGAGFPDVAAGSYCENAVKWAAANGITAGGTDGLFRPGDSITRQQLATFLYRYNNYKGYMVAKQADLDTFPDGETVSSYARDALSWANGTGLVNGTTDGRLNPFGGATRGQAAAILHRFCVSVGK